MAPLPPCSRKLLDETVKTFAVFPSWLCLLDGEDNCMLSVPSSTSDLHYSSSKLMKTPTLSTEDPAQEDLLQKYKERVERLSQPDQLVKICTDVGFLKTVEVGQYFMTKHTDEFLQFTGPVTCREHTLPRDGNSTDPKVWIRGNIKIGPVSEVTTSYLQSEYGVENRSVNKGNSHPWVRISHGLNKLVTDLIDKKYEAVTSFGSTFWFSLHGGCSSSLPVLLSCPRVVCSISPAFSA